MAWLLTLSRIALWSAVSLSVVWAAHYFYPEYLPIEWAMNNLAEKLKWFFGDEYSPAKVADYLKGIIVGLHGLLIGGGAAGAKFSHDIDPMLNGERYWISDMRDAEPTMGYMHIDNIHKRKVRLGEPFKVIRGYTIALAADGSEENVSPFVAREIIGGSRTRRALYFEWDTQEGSSTFSGMTVLNFIAKQNEGFFSRKQIEISGKFLLDATTGSGTLKFYSDKGEALSVFRALQVRWKLGAH